MTPNVSETKTDNGSFAALTGIEQRTLSLLLVTRDVRCLGADAQENSIFDAELILTQGDEPLMLG